MMSGQYFPYTLGDKHATMAGTKGSEAAMWSKSHQSRSQFGLQAETRLHEAGIASNGRSAILPWIRSRVLYKINAPGSYKS